MVSHAQGIGPCTTTETTMTDRQARAARNQERSLAALLAKKAEFDIGQMRKTDRHDFLETSLMRSKQAPMPGNQAPSIIHRHRHVEAELGDRGRDLRDLLVRMSARVRHVGQQGGDRARLDGARRPWGLGHLHLRDRGLDVAATGNLKNWPGARNLARSRRPHTARPERTRLAGLRQARG